MKKILGLSIAALLVIALVGGGTWAYFSDTETISNNTITAGTLALTTDNATPAAFSIANTFPSDENEAAAWQLINDGTIDGWLEVKTSAIDHTDKLANYLKLLLWIDKNNNGVLNTGDVYLTSTGTINSWSGVDGTDPGAAAAEAIAELAKDLDGTTWGTAVTPVLRINDGVNTNYFSVYYYFPDNDADQNDAQGDAVSVNLTFTLKQTTTQE
jgi:spore coat-associated protein N